MKVSTVRQPSADEIADFKRRIAKERQDAREAAAAMVQACAKGDVDRFLAVADQMTYVVDGWRLAMLGISRLSHVTPRLRRAFMTIWIEHKHLPLAVGHRPTMAAALRVLMAGDYRGRELRIFRGSRVGEARRRIYGFSWTKKLSIARQFADQNPQGEGVVFEVVAPASAVLLNRRDNGYYDEGEVVVDPFALRGVKILERGLGTLQYAPYTSNRVQ